MAYFDNSYMRQGRSHSIGQSVYERIGKRFFDLVLALCLLPFLTPLIALFWVLTRLQGRTGFFGHDRIGRDGRSFRCWKIRTMIPDAQAMLEHHLHTDPSAAAEWAQCQKLSHDPRVTRLGQILRRTSLDELPQIWNVIKGEMSFVGPRPVTEDELSRYGAERTAYLGLRPGITGLWQIEGRSNGCYTERTRLDCLYAGQMGLVRDLCLILRTPLVLVWPTGR